MSQEDSKLSTKLDQCGSMLQEWNVNKFGKVQARIKTLKDRLLKLSNVERSVDVVTNEYQLSAELDEWLAREELLWKQRSRMDWLKEGDRDTTFFKLKASQRKAKKLVKIL